MAEKEVASKNIDGSIEEAKKNLTELSKEPGIMEEMEKIHKEKAKEEEERQNRI